MNRNAAATSPDSYQLQFRPLRGSAPGYVFPCDAAGTVDLDTLNDRTRNDYFFARGLIGRQVDSPRVLRCR